MITPPVTCPGRKSVPVLCLCLVLAALAGGCEAEAVELARDIQAARGECTAERLRASDEECVRMMERYAGITADLVDTYIGGVRSLDMALDRMPPMGFDTAGLGYAINPEYRAGDPLGEGASARLWPALGGDAALRSSPSIAPDGYRSFPSAGLPSRPAERLQLREGSWRGPATPPIGEREAHIRAGGVTGLGSRTGRGRFDRPFGYDPYGWRGLPFADGFRYDIFDSGPYGYFNAPWASFGYGPFEHGYGYEYGPYGHGSYGFPRPHAGEYMGGYGRSPYIGGYFDGYGAYPDGPRDYGYGLYPRNGYYRGTFDAGERYYDRGYGLDDPYERGYMGRDGGHAYGAGSPAVDVGTPAEEWGYEPEPVDGGSSPSTVDRAEPAQTGPPRHRPGILLPPEERLWRPWLED